MDDLGSQNFDTEGFLTAPFAVIYRWGDGEHDFGIIMENLPIEKGVT